MYGENLPGHCDWEEIHHSFITSSLTAGHDPLSGSSHTSFLLKLPAFCLWLGWRQLLFNEARHGESLGNLAEGIGHCPSALKAGEAGTHARSRHGRDGERKRTKLP